MFDASRAFTAADLDRGGDEQRGCDRRDEACFDECLDEV
jgi:hypothetical protein